MTDYNPKLYKTWTWKSPVVLYWVVNPALVINELLLGVTFPLRGWFRKSLRQRWPDRHPSRYSGLNQEIEDPAGRKGYWLATGIVWGVVMYALVNFVIPLVSQQPVTTKAMLIGIPIWLLGGLAYGYTMRTWMNRRGTSVAKTKRN